MHLSGNDSFLRLRGDIHAGHHQFTVQYICFKQHSDFPADEPGVDALNGWLEFCREVGKLHHLGFI